MFAGRERWWLTAVATLASVCFASVVVAEALHTSRDKSAPRGMGHRERPRVKPSSPFDHAERAAAARRIGVQILARNLFDAQTGPLDWEAPSAPPAAVPEAMPPALEPQQAEETPRCAPNLRLVASLVRHTAPHSLATIRRDDRTYLLAAGAELEGLTLESVLPSAVYLRARSGASCLLRLREPGGSPPEDAATSRALPPPAPESKPKPKGFFAQDELSQGVRALGEGEYAVSRKLVLRALSDPGKAAAGAIFGPSLRKGEPGMEIRAIKEGTLLQRMGLQDGDVVRSLSGADLTNASGLLDALRTVRQSDSVSLVLVRDHVAKTIEYLLD